VAIKSLALAMLLALGAQTPVFATSKGLQFDGCGRVHGSARTPKYHSTQEQRRRYLRLRAPTNRRHIQTGEATDLLKRCDDTTLGATTGFPVELSEYRRGY